MEKRFLSAEQAEGSHTIVIHTSTSRLWAKVEDVLNYITANKLNAEDTYGGNTGSGEPWNELPSVEEITDPADYLDRHFEEVMKQFWYTELKQA